MTHPKEDAIVNATRTPGIGDVVLYIPCLIDPNHNGAAVLPAIVTRVWSPDQVNLNVQTDGHGVSPFPKTSVTFGKKAGQWSWRPGT